MKALSQRLLGRLPPSEATAPASAQKQHHRPRIPKENVDPSSTAATPTEALPVFGSPSSCSGKPLAARNRSPLPPRHPPPANPLKRKLCLETLPENGAPSSLAMDSGVQVVVRMRPMNKELEEGQQIVQKISPDSVSIVDHTFTFDSVADSGASQEDIFRLVGLPLVDNCLAGFNSSIFAYGQTGSGKTYTMWGVPSSLVEDGSLSQESGLTPRVFEQLFSRIEEERAKNSETQLTYQCRCSFLEIYNEQITDLLDPNLKNLQIREDVKIGVYVDYLKEEYVSSMKDVAHLLRKGLANRRTGATSINSESSRSHCVFTCIVESRSQSMVDGLSSFRTRRINLVDLAGSERQKLTGAAGERLKEAGNINRSLSQLGNLINILAEVSQSGKQRHIPYRDSKLTFLLQESLGGNAKLAMICAISPSKSCKSETFSTLRFAQRAKAIKNKAVVNEITEDNVDILREQIRQLKEEILRMKSNGASVENGGYSTGWSARRSLNLLRMSLCRQKALPLVKEDSDEEMEIDEEDVEKPCTQEEGMQLQLAKKKQTKNLDSTEEKHGALDSVSIGGKRRVSSSSGLQAVDLSIVPIAAEYSTVPGDNALSPILHSPTMSISPRVETCSRKSLRTSLSASASQKIVRDLVDQSLSFSKSPNLDLVDSSPTQTEYASPASTTERLEASLQLGCQIIDSHQHSSGLSRSSFRFSPRPVDLRRVDVGIQTLPLDSEIPKDIETYICTCCKRKISSMEGKDVSTSADLQLVPVDDKSLGTDKPKNQVLKAVEKVLAGAIRREMALEDQCTRQAAEITQLNRLMQQYKHERECYAIVEQTREDKISRLESLMDGIISPKEFKNEELTALTDEFKILKENYENHPDVLRANVELKRVQEELDGYKNFFDLGERDVLMEEIQDLRNQLQYYMSSPASTRRIITPFLRSLPSAAEPAPFLWSLPSTAEPAPAPLEVISESPEDDGSNEEKLEQEIRRWTEAESNWISISEELRLELEASRSLADRQKLELDSEKKCAEELKEALQMAMQGHARILEQYADLEEKHIGLLGRHRRISDSVADVKRAAAKAGVRGAESRFIDSLAAEILALKSERDKERRQWREEKKRLQAQLRDTAEAVQAAGELVVGLKEAEEAAAIAQRRAATAEQETEKAYQEIDNLKKNYDDRILLLNGFLAESRLPKEALLPRRPEPATTSAAAEGREGESLTDERWREEFEPFREAAEEDEFSKGTQPYSWYSDYDCCNI